MGAKTTGFYTLRFPNKLPGSELVYWPEVFGPYVETGARISPAKRGFTEEVGLAC